MILIALYCFTLVISPPPIVKTKFGGSDNWVLHENDFETGKRIINEFYSSYDDVENKPDFSINMQIPTGIPQIYIAMSKNEKIKAVFNAHNYITYLQITSIATPIDEYEVAKVFFDLVEQNDVLDIDVIELQRKQPKWLLAYNFYTKKM